VCDLASEKIGRTIVLERHALGILHDRASEARRVGNPPANCKIASMKQGLRIRPFQSKDESEVVLLVRELQDHEAVYFDRMAPSSDIGSWYVSRVLREARDSGGELIVAELDGRIVGYATLLTRQSSETSIDEVLYTYAYVGDLIVTKSARGRGVGAQLLQECERLARAAGERWLRITVLAANPQAIEVYKRFGFTDQLIDMEKPLR
jgi:ribosomal protein S18 acetylase RimI-like enzyme